MHINFYFYIANIRSRTNINKINTSHATLNQATGDRVYLKGKKENEVKGKKEKVHSEVVKQPEGGIASPHYYYSVRDRKP